MKVKELSKYSFGGQTNLAFDECVKKVTDTLREEGFGILEIAATLISRTMVPLLYFEYRSRL